jgi:Cu(I)/Ag(I) efflux system membrane protein CusA/SilA
VAVQTGVVKVVYLEARSKKRMAERGAAFNAAGSRAGRERRRTAAAASIGDDRSDHGGELAADHGESSSGGGSDEAARDAVHRQHGGSLIHILIVTPVIFCWLRERELLRLTEPRSKSPRFRAMVTG